MTDRPDTPEDPLQEDVSALEHEERESHANMLTLEICFLGAVGVVVLLAFMEALSYQLVSSRTPFVIMVPLFILIVIHAMRLYRHRAEADFGHRLRMAFGAQMPGLNKVVLISIWLGILLGIIVVLGHYIGLFVFCFMLMWRLGGVPAVKAAIVAAGTVVLMYVLFEIAFNLELYRGLFFRWLAGYRDF